MSSEIRAITVKQLNFYAKNLLDNDRNLKSLTVKGEISGFVLHQRSGHAYFTLKDDFASVKTVMFSSAFSSLSFVPENGMKVFVQGKISLYERDGQFQLYAERMILQGVGESYLSFLELKDKLEREGLFSAELKKTLPKYPETVGVVTSPTGAAIQDFINVISKRFPCVNLCLYPVNVQGDKTVDDVVSALSYFEKNPVDVIVITRGGGSYEDLSVFNSEILARKVFDAKIPIVSAIGHEIDFTVIDFVADFRAPTPSAAAEAVVPDREALKISLYEKQKYIDRIIENRISNDKIKLSLYSKKTDISSRFESENIRLDNLYNKIFSSFKMIYNSNLSDLKFYTEKINALNPLSVLSKGFSFSLKNGIPLKTVNDLAVGDKFTVIFKDGEVDCAAEKIRKRNDL